MEFWNLGVIHFLSIPYLRGSRRSGVDPKWEGRAETEMDSPDPLKNYFLASTKKNDWTHRIASKSDVFHRPDYTRLNISVKLECKTLTLVSE